MYFAELPQTQEEVSAQAAIDTDEHQTSELGSDERDCTEYNQIDDVATFYRDKHADLVGYARGFTGGDVASAEDLVHIVVEQVLRRIQNGHTIESLPSYVGQSIRNRASDRVRHSSYRNLIHKDCSGLLDEISDPEDECHRTIEIRDREVAVHSLLEQCSDRHRAVLEDRYFSGMTNAEIAAKHGLDPSVSAALSYRALKHVRRQAHEAGITPDMI